jgi:hypothetical protein
MAAENTIRVVLYPQGNTWIAQALEYDLAACAASIRESMKRMVATIADAHAFTVQKFGRPFEGIEPAPARFFDMFEQADFDISPRDLEDDELPVGEILPHIAARFLEESCAERR